MARRSLVSPSFLPLALLTLLGAACSSAPSGGDGATREETADLSNCTTNPTACGGGGPPTSCQAICEGSTTCQVIRAGTKSCACTGSCGAGLTCSAGHCVTPPPTCTGAPPVYREWWVPGAHYVNFRQLSPGEAPNPDTQCASGCGPTAWAMFFAVVESRWNATNNASWFAPFIDSNGIEWGNNYPQITMDIAHHIGASCISTAGEAYTEPSWMASAADYLNQGPEAAYTPHGPLGGYTTSGFTYQYDVHDTDDSLLPDYDNDYGTLTYAKDWIVNHGYPVVYGYMIGANVISNAHYALVTGYHEKATAWNCENVGGQMQFVPTTTDPSTWEFYFNGGNGDTDGWKRPAAFYVGTIKIDQQ
jgi:hypothetical protein